MMCRRMQKPRKDQLTSRDIFIHQRNAYSIKLKSTCTDKFRVPGSVNNGFTPMLTTLGIEKPNTRKGATNATLSSNTNIFKPINKQYG